MAIAELPPHAEPSASEGILCERFVCGPPSICSASARTLPPHRFYDSEFGRVFYERNVWPKDDGGALQAAAETAYPGFERLAHGCMQVIAAALGLPHTAFDELVSAQSPAHLAAPLRHHSRLQINNYPSQLPARGVAYTTCPLRASRHFDTSLLTVLDREPRVDTEAVAGSSGALEVFLPSRGSAAGGIGDGADGEWTCVPARPGEMTVFLGNLAGLLSGFRLAGTTHRVSNPDASVAADARRLSVGFNLKPDYSHAAGPPAGVRAALPALPAAAAAHVPAIGLVGRVGWQNHAMQTRGLSRREAVSAFKTWKNATMARLRDAAAYGEKCVY